MSDIITFMVAGTAVVDCKLTVIKKKRRIIRQVEVRACNSEPVRIYRQY